MPATIPPEEDAQLRALFAQFESETTTPDSEPLPDSEPEDEPLPDDEPDEGGDDEPDDEPSTSPSTSTSPSPSPEPSEATVDINGTSFTHAELADLLRLREYLDGSLIESTRSASQALEQARQQASTFPPNSPSPALADVSEAPTPPPDLDLDDPNIRVLWDNYAQLSQMVEAQRLELVRRENVETASFVEKACEDYQSKYRLDNSKMESLRLSAAQTGVGLALRNQGKSVYDSVIGALDAAFWSNPTLREAYLQGVEADNKTRASAQRRKEQKLASISGRQSAPRTTRPPESMTREERNQAMIAELAEAIGER